MLIYLPKDENDDRKEHSRDDGNHEQSNKDAIFM